MGKLYSVARFIASLYGAQPPGRLEVGVPTAAEGGRQGFCRSPVSSASVAAPEKHALPNSEAPLIFLKVNYAEKVIEVWGQDKSLCYLPFEKWLEVTNEIGWHLK